MSNILYRLLFLALIVRVSLTRDLELKRENVTGNSLLPRQAVAYLCTPEQIQQLQDTFRATTALALRVYTVISELIDAPSGYYGTRIQFHTGRSNVVRDLFLFALPSILLDTSEDSTIVIFG